MDISQTNATSFGAGKVSLLNLKKESLSTYENIKALAENTASDIFIKKGEGLKSFPRHDLTVVSISKEDCLLGTRSVTRPVLSSKKASPQNISEQILESIKEAYESLCDKIRKERSNPGSIWKRK